MIANGNFAGGLGGWSQGNGNGAVNEWVIVGGKARGFPESKILNQPLPLDKYQTYKLSLDLTLNSGCTIYVVGYKSYDGPDGGSNYDIIATITETGTQTVSFTPAVDYVRIGFILVGDCTNSDLDNISMYKAEYDCLDICIKDLDGNEVATVTDIDYFGGYATVTVDWGALDLDDGCYYICVCNSGDVFFGENLFTLGDNGTFEEDDTTGISSEATTPARTTAQAYAGIYSYGMVLGNGTLSMLITTDFTLKRNTQYKITARVWADASAYVSAPETIYWDLPANTGFTGAVRDSYTWLDIDSQDEEWIEVSMVFTTGTDNVGHFELLWTATGVTGGLGYIDNIVLYEVDAYEQCSQGFSLKDSHSNALLLKYRNDNPAFNFIYPDGFYFYMYIPAALQHPRYPEELKTFRTTDGIGSVAYADSSKVHVLAVNSIPEYMHDALRIALLHSTLYIDDALYVKIPAEYRPLWDRGAYLAPVEVEVQQVDQKTENAKC